MEAVAAPPPFALKPTATASYRINSIDLLRGLVMIIMALDHTRDFFHQTALVPGQDPLNLETTSPTLFFTRWITHFCAPIFVFLAGTSGYLQSLRKPKKELSRFLITRGLWLVLMELTLINFAVTFDHQFGTFALQTIWSIGISMVLLGLAIWLPFPLIAVLGFLIVFGHNALDFYEYGKRQQQLGWFYDLLHRPNFFPISGNRGIFVMYPFLPWTGLMLLGYCFGRLFTVYEGPARRKMLLTLGLGIIGFFILLRATNLYGDAQHWSAQKNGLYTIFSFINTVKYPPSLLYMCMTIGPGILLLALTDKVKGKISDAITVYGRVPFLYYVLHFYLLHIITAIMFLARGHSFQEGVTADPNNFLRFVRIGEGVSLGVVYLIWTTVVLALYPVCKWFSDYKRRNKHWWLSYL